MAHTQHGWPVPGTTLVETVRVQPTCPGPHLCRPCSSEIERLQRPLYYATPQEGNDCPRDAKEVVVTYINELASKNGHNNWIAHHDVYVVWFSYVLGNWKALVCTTRPDGMYYEVTFDHAKSLIYLDAYKKTENVARAWPPRQSTGELNQVVETMRLVRKSFPVDVVQVTKANMEDVAKWCGGKIEEDERRGKYIFVPVVRPAHLSQTRAFVGDWVLHTDGNSYKVFLTKNLWNTFEEPISMFDVDTSRKLLEIFGTLKELLTK